MKYLILILAITALLFSSCDKDQETIQCDCGMIENIEVRYVLVADSTNTGHIEKTYWVYLNYECQDNDWAEILTDGESDMDDLEDRYNLYITLTVGQEYCIH